MKCDPNKEDLNGALCYPKCHAKDGHIYTGKGPVCWETQKEAPKLAGEVSECPGWDCDVPGTTCTSGDGYCCNADKKWTPGKCRA